MSRISGESTSRSIDRRQWSDLDSVDHELLLFGHGEGYVEEVYFGKGFSQAPTFTFSAFFQQDEEAVIPRYLTSPRGSLTREVDEYGLGNDSQSHSGLIQDPGFESQAKYHVINNDYAVAATTIPTVNRFMNDFTTVEHSPFTGFPSAYFPVMQLLDDTTLNNTWSYKFKSFSSFDEPYGPHRWVQTSDTRDMWTVDLTESHDLGVGEAGQASATAIIGSNGFTNWLIPFQVGLGDFITPIGVGFFQHQTIDTPEYQWRGIKSTEESSNLVHDSLGGALYAQAYPAPYLGGFVGMMYVKSESEVEVQVNATFANWDDTSRRHENNFGKKIMDDTHWTWVAGTGDGPEPQPDEYSYRELASIDFNHVHTGSSGWGRVDVSLPYDGIRAWPNADHCLSRHRQPTITWWTLRFRVKGVPGTRVYLDNIYMDVEQRNSEIPILTIGVDEWIRDEAGVYIGAKLWIKSGTPSGNTCNILDLSGEDWTST